jgi:hypothetical protein
MNDDSRSAHFQLGLAAASLAQEIWDGKWAHIADLRKKPVGECADLVDELARRCPGFGRDDYARAIARGMFEQR